MATPDQAFRHVCDILDLDEPGYTYLKKHRITNVRRLVNTTNEHYSDLFHRDPSVLNESDLDQIEIFRFWYTEYRSKAGEVDPQDFMNDLTETEWESYTNNYMSMKLANVLAHNSPPPRAAAPTSQDSGALKVTLKDYPTTSGKAKDWPRYRRKFITTATANGHDEVLGSTY